MCTLSVVTHDSGYYLAMNRDELVSRGAAAPPAQFDLGKTRAIYPRDIAGGTWIAANSHGVAFALLNWNDVPQSGASKQRSRGCVIPNLIRLNPSHEVTAALPHLDLKGIMPFRLVGVFPAEMRMWEWRWNHEKLESEPHDWERRHWFSSGLSDEQAARQRSAVCQSSWNEEGAGSLPWLRRLHSSHVHGPGPFSLCVHREKVTTLSYTEFICTPEKVECNYFTGSPCTMRGIDSSVEIARASRWEDH